MNYLYVQKDNISLYSPLSFLLSYTNAQNLRFRHITTDDGLPSNYCWLVMKDSRGFIWITTRAGLARYDGYDMKVYQYNPLDTVSLSDNRISFAQDMVEDKEGNLWIGTVTGLNKFDAVSESFIRYTHDPNDPGSIGSNQVNCLFIDYEGSLWIGTGNRGGLNKHLPDNDQFKVYPRNPADSNWRLKSIYSLFEDSRGTFWVGTNDGLFQFDRKTETFTRILYDPAAPDPSDPIVYKYITEDIDGTLFIGTQFGFLTYDRTKKKLIPEYPFYDETLNVRWLEILSDQSSGDYTHWVVTGGLFRYNQKLSTVIQIESDPTKALSITGYQLKSIYRDESGMLWIPGELGVNIMDPGQDQLEFHPFVAENFSFTNVFLEDNKGHFWIGSSGLVHCNETMIPVKIYDHFPVKNENESFSGAIWSLFEDNAKNVWIGSDYNGLYLLQNGKKEIVCCHLPPKEPAFIYDIYEDSKGTLWVGTDEGLYLRKQEERPLTLFRQDSAYGIMNYTTILFINEDRNQNVWIGTTNNGLFCQSPDLRKANTFVNYRHDPDNSSSISNDWVWAMYEDRSNGLWFATEHGINRFNTEENAFTSFLSDTDLGANFIYDLTGDDRGYLWMTTESGVIRFNTVDAVHMGKSGYRYKQILPFSNIFPYRIYKNKAGKIFVAAAYASGNGYYSFYPDSIRDNKFIPNVVITQFSVRNELQKLDSSIILKKHLILRHNQNFFSCECAALDYMDPPKNQYAHYLEGLENDWIYTGSNRIANYTGVPPGDYVFHVKGSNNHGYWNDAGKDLSITILPPPWKTWWAYVIYGLGILGTGYMILRFYIKRLRLSHRLEIEHLEAQKLKELDSMKSRFFANISHEFRTPLTLILGPIEKHLPAIRDKELIQDMTIMRRNARRLQNLINQLLDLSRLESRKMELHASEENIVTLVKSYVQQFESLARHKGITLECHSEKDDIPAFVDRDKTEKILYNLLGNAFKFTDVGGRIEVAIVSAPPQSPPFGGEGSCIVPPDVGGTTGGAGKGQCVVISISDTGTGIPPEKLPRIFDRFYQAGDSYVKDTQGSGIGLALTKELVELHGGTITVESVVNQGSTFRVFLPVGERFLKGERREEKGERRNRGGGFEVKVGRGMHYDEYEIQDVERETRNAESGTKKEAPLLLIVKDNADLRLYIRGHLQPFYQIIEAGDGEQGLERAIEHIPDLILTDVMMPRMDGFELCRNLKSDERTSHIPIILLTARAGTESRIEGLETGADDFISKPFDSDELLVRIKNLIAQRNRLQKRFLKNIVTLGIFPLLHLDTPDLTSMDQRFLQKAVKLVMDHIADPEFNVDTFGASISLSRRQLHRKLTALTGHPPSQFIRSLRLSRAAGLIAKKTGTITEIAYEVGFNNLSYFARCFQEEFGCSPSEYANSKYHPDCHRDKSQANPN